MENVEFGRALRKMREHSGKTVPEVSEHLTALGYKAKSVTIYGWERGVSQPNPDPFLEMCKFYGVTDILSYFGGGSVETENSPSAAEAEPGEDVRELMEALDRSLAQMGYIGADDDLTEQQEEVLIGICRILRATFKKK